MTQWQPIDSAPRDGTPFLAASVNHDGIEVVCWQDGVESGCLASIEDPDLVQEGWVNRGPIKDRFYANPRWFTHWAPLPEPPSAEPEPSAQAAETVDRISRDESQ